MATAAAAAAAQRSEQRLRGAARRGDAKKLAALLRGAVDANAADADGRTALHFAAEAGNVEAAALLLERGGDVAAAMADALAGGPEDWATEMWDRRRNDGWQPLHFAAAEGHAALVALLLAHTADAGAADAFGSTPLFYAARYGHIDAVRAFLDAGVLAGAPCTSDGEAALHAAGSSGVAALLLERGADAHAADGEGRTPLHRLVECGGDAATLEVLLAAGADVNAADEHGKTPLHIAASSHKNPESAAAVRVLLAAGAHLEAVSSGLFSCRPLHGAASMANLGALRELLRHGADVHARDGNGETALHRACWTPLCFENKPGVIKALLDAGADVKAVDESGRQPLHLLAGAENDAWDEETIRICTAGAEASAAYLAAAGADLDAADAGGRTPLMNALENPVSPVLRALAHHGARTGPPQCGACADLGAQRTALRSLFVAAAAEMARLRREREAWKEERETWREERAALDAARAAPMVEAAARSAA